jgi:hypothetical protein
VLPHDQIEDRWQNLAAGLPLRFPSVRLGL